MSSLIVLVSTLSAWLGECARQPLKIVHLGDSYSAGNGARGVDGTKNYFHVQGCRRSPTNWGQLYSNIHSVDWAITYINRACSGAQLQHLTGARDMGKITDVLGDNCKELAQRFPDEEIWSGCNRSLKAQIVAVDSTVDIVLLTIGGNDVGFTDILTQCLVVWYRGPSSCEAAVAGASDALLRFGGRLVATLAELRRRLKPGSIVVLVTYPHVVLEASPYELCDRQGCLDAGRLLRSLSVAMDEVLSVAASNANDVAGQSFVYLFDRTKALFRGHEPDPSAERRNPDRWMFEFLDALDDPWSMYHPNAEGHRRLAAALPRPAELLGNRSNSTPRSSVDLAFVIDTTGSMSGMISSVTNRMVQIVGDLANNTRFFRVAIVTFRDFPSRADSSSYPARVDLNFTSDGQKIQQAIARLSVDGGGDTPETLLSGVNLALGLNWTAGVTKAIIVMTDAPALVDESGAEPISKLTASQLTAKSLALDPVSISSVGYNDSTLQLLRKGTGGSHMVSPSGTGDAFVNFTKGAIRLPFAWMGFAVIGRINVPIQFDASGSFDPAGGTIRLYEWDFNGDGQYEFSSSAPKVNFTYTSSFEGVSVLRVTATGGMALASAYTIINEVGFEAQTKADPCPLDADGYSLANPFDVGLQCTVTNLRLVDKPDVIVISGSTITTTLRPTTVIVQDNALALGTLVLVCILFFLVLIVTGMAVVFACWCCLRKPDEAGAVNGALSRWWRAQTSPTIPTTPQPQTIPPSTAVWL